MRIKDNINIKRKIKYFFLKIIYLKLAELCIPFLKPYGAPHELHTNRPDNERSALKLELPQIKHLFAFIIF